MSKSILTFSDVAYRYPALADDSEAAADRESPLVFNHFSAEIPGGFTCLTGPNGSGKSTFMLLAGGRLLPENGCIKLCGTDTRLFSSEEDRNKICSFVYQNMEFETEETTGTLIEAIFANGLHCGNDSQLLDMCCKSLELSLVLDRPLQHLSKGEMQRVLIAFAVLYGSPVIMMDEPMFAMEQRQKESALDFLTVYSKEKNSALYLSLHELDLARKYAQNVLLFYPDRTISMGTPDEVLIDADLEKAYGVPAAMLKDKESIDRNALIEQARLLNGADAQGHSY